MNPSKKIDELIASLTDWRGPMLAKIRKIFHEANSDVVEEWKYMGTPTYYCNGLIAITDAYKTSVKIGFLYGASLPDPDKIFNDELKGNQRRAIKLYEGDELNEKALKKLIKSAIEFNSLKKK